MIEVQLFDGTVLQFPAGTSDDVIDRVARQETEARRGQSPATPPAETDDAGREVVNVSQGEGESLEDYRARVMAMIREGKRPVAQVSDRVAQENAAIEADIRAPMAEPNIPEGMFYNPETGQYTSRELLQNNMEPTNAGSFGRGTLSGMTFNFDDEIRAAGAATRGLLTGEDGAGQFELERARAMQAADMGENPVANTLGVVTGAMVPAMATASASVGPTMGNTILRSGAIGAGEGALFGAGRGEGAEGRGATAVTDGLLGAGMGAAAPAAFVGARAGYRGARNLLTGTPNQAAGSQAISRVVAQSNRTPAQIADDLARAAAEGQPEYRLMDALGPVGQRRTSGIVRAGGDGAEELQNFLTQRQAGQTERLSSFIDDAFGMGGDTAAQRQAALTAAQSEAADAAYAAARGNAAPVDVRSALGVIDDRLRPMQGADVVGDGIDSKLASYRSRLAANPATLEDGVTSVELSDFDRVLGVKQVIQDDIGAAVRAGRNNEARILGQLSSELDSALEAASPSYRAANDGFRDASRVIEAIDDGTRAARPAQRGADTVDWFNSLTPEQQAAARVGYGDRFLTQIEANPAPTANRARALTTPKTAQERAAMALNPDEFGQQLGRETTMWETQNRVLGGSRTADNLADIDGNLGGRSGLLGMVRSAANLNLGDAAAQAFDTLAPMLRGESESTRQAIARALMSSNPEAALAEALETAGRADLIEAATTALARISGRERVGAALR